MVGAELSGSWLSRGPLKSQVRVRVMPTQLKVMLIQLKAFAFLGTQLSPATGHHQV